MATYSATSLVIEKSSARAAPAARSRSASARSVSTRASALASAVGIAGLDEQGVDAVGGDVAVAVEARWRRRSSRRPSPRSARRRRTRRAATGRRTPRRRAAGRTSRRRRSVRATRSGRRRRSAARKAGPSGPSLAIHSRASAGSLANASSSTASPLRSSWRPQKKIVGPVACTGGAAAIVAMSTPLNSIRIPSACFGKCDATSSRASLDTTTLTSMRRSRRSSTRLEHPVARRHAGGVERADDRRAAHHQRRHRRPGGERLVDVEHVELLVAQGADRAQRGRGVGRQRGDRPVGRRRQAVAERRDERFRRRAVARSEHPRLVALAAQLAGQAEHLGLHAAGHAEAVGADDPDPQRPPQLHGSGP